MRLLVLACLIAASGCNLAGSKKAPGPRDPDAASEFTTTDSGLKYRVLRQGTGAKPHPRSYVTVDYVGWLDDGTEFDTSYNKGESVGFKLQQVIPAWTEGMQLIGEGGMIELEVPSELGYGQSGSPPKIPPDATLHFIIELRKTLNG